jgi:hypothetical protein
LQGVVHFGVFHRGRVFGRRLGFQAFCGRRLDFGALRGNLGGLLLVTPCFCRLGFIAVSFGVLVGFCFGGFVLSGFGFVLFGFVRLVGFVLTVLLATATSLLLFLGLQWFRWWRWKLGDKRQIEPENPEYRDRGCRAVNAERCRGLARSR